MIFRFGSLFGLHRTVRLILGLGRCRLLVVFIMITELIFLLIVERGSRDCAILVMFDGHRLATATDRDRTKFILRVNRMAPIVRRQGLRCVLGAFPLCGR